MFLIVGLGNPGARYMLTRHNVGFMALDYFVKAFEAERSTPKEEFDSITTTFKVDDMPLMLVKPQSYMNNSGKPVAELMHYYKVPAENILIVCDDLDQPFGQLRIRTKSGDGGHNGLKSLIEHLGSNEFARVKIGIGRPAIAAMDVADYVLQNFSKDEQARLPDVLNSAVDAMESVIFDGLIPAMNKFNGKTIKE